MSYSTTFSMPTGIRFHTLSPKTFLKKPPFRRHVHSHPAVCSYSKPDVYDIAFGFRDFHKEAAFLVSQYNNSHQSSSASQNGLVVLDIGCGPAPHLRAIARQVPGCHPIGVDASQAMLDYAATRWREAHTKPSLHRHEPHESFNSLETLEKNPGGNQAPHFFLGDFTSPAPERSTLDDKRSFSASFSASSSAKGGEGPHWTTAIGLQKVDLAVCLLGTFAHCESMSAALQCFRNCSYVMKNGGIFVLELSHPDDLFSGAFYGDDFVECWEAEENRGLEEEEQETTLKRDHDMKHEEQGENDQDASSCASERKDRRRVLVEYGREGDVFDPSSQILHRTVGLVLYEGDDLVSCDVTTVAQRQFTRGEIETLAWLAGFEVVRIYGDMDSSIAIMDEDAHRLVVILEKKGSTI